MRIKAYLDKIAKALSGPKKKLVLLLILGGLVATASFGEPGDGGTPITNAFSPPPKQTVLELQGNEATYDLITLHSGEVTFSKTIFYIPSRGLDFIFTLNYRSQGQYDGPFGWNWDSPLNQRLEELPNGDVRYYNGFGRRDTFTKSGSTYISPVGYYQTLTKSADGTFTLTNPQHIMTHFRSDGKLSSIEDTNGNRLTFIYDADGRLSKIVDALEREIIFTYYESTNRLKYVTDFTGRHWTFIYTDDGDLWKIISPATPDSPSGRTDEFYYLNHNLSTITLPSGKVYRTITYGTGDTSEVARQINLDATATIDYDFNQRITTVTEPNGNKFEIRFTPATSTPPYAPMQRTDYTNLNIRPGESDYTTTYQYNSNGEQTKITFPRGNSIETTFDDTNPDVKKRGNLLSFTQRSNPTITATYTYEPRYNKVKTITDPEGNVTTNYYDYEEATLGDLNGDGITNQSRGNLVKTTYPTVTVPAIQTASETYVYNRYGQLIRSTDARGVKTRYIYFGYGDPRYGYLRDVIRDIGKNGLNIRTRYDVDKLGNIISETDPKGTKTTYERNALGEILSKKILGSETIYQERNTYDADGNVVKFEVELRDKNGSIDNTWIATEYSYDENGLLIITTETISATQTAVTRYEYDGNMNLVRVTKPEGNKTRYIYDERNLLYQQVDGEGASEASTRTINYDANGNISEEISGEDTTTTYLYDGFDRLIRKTRPLGNYTAYSYDSRDNLIQIANYSATDQLLARTSYRYDERSRNYQIEQLILDENLTTEAIANTRYTYDAVGNLIKITDPLGNNTTYTYDNDRRLTKITDPVGNQTEYVYDLAGNCIKEIRTDQNELGGTEETTTTYTYDSVNRMICIQDGLGNAINYAYDSLNHLLKITDPKGDTGRYKYDYQGRKTKDIFDLRDSSDTITNTINIIYTYDKNDNLTGEQDDNNNFTTYQYDAKDRLVKRVNADNTFISYEYDRDDRLIKVVDENETTVTYTYDANDNLTQIDIQKAPGVEGITQERYQYDGLDRRIRYEDSSGTIQEYKYDSLNRLRKEIENSEQISSSYDLAGRRTTITYPGGTSISLLRTTNGLIDEVRVGGSQLVDYKYVGDRTKERNFANNTKSIFTYDNVNRLTRLVHQKTVGSVTFADFEYGYDKNSNRAYEKRNHEGGKGDVYTYDSLNRLIGVKYQADSPETGGTNPVSQTTYQYDGVGNRIQVVTDSTTEAYTMDDTLPEPADKQMNQYTTVTATRYLYDKVGNLIDDGTNTYVYDYKNRLVRVRRKSDNRDIAFYTYDGMNRRLSKRIWDDVSSVYTTTTFIWDGWQIVEERDTSDTVVAKYVYGRGIDEPLIMERGGTRYYYHANVLGSITQVTNSSGNVVEKYSYDVYGKPTIKDASNTTITTSAISNRYMFTGREYDSETGFYYYRNRYYEPKIGRFLVRDPADTDALLNLFAYVCENPINRVDALGLASKDKQNLSVEDVNKKIEEVDTAGLLNIVDALLKAKEELGYQLTRLEEISEKSTNTINKIEQLKKVIKLVETVMKNEYDLQSLQGLKIIKEVLGLLGTSSLLKGSLLSYLEIGTETALEGIRTIDEILYQKYRELAIHLGEEYLPSRYKERLKEEKSKEEKLKLRYSILLGKSIALGKRRRELEPRARWGIIFDNHEANLIDEIDKEIEKLDNEMKEIQKEKKRLGISIFDEGLVRGIFTTYYKIAADKYK